MNINYNYYNKQILINQIVEQTKFNIARLTNLENIINKLNSINTNTLVKTIDKEVNGYKLLSNSNIKDIVLSDNQATFNNVINGDYMFNCPGISIIDLPNAEFNNLVSCNYMFTTLDYNGSNYYETLTEINLPKATFNNLSTINCDYLFCKFNNLTKLNLHDVKFDKITSSYYMFGFMPNLIDLDLSSATFKNVTSGYYMFGNLNSIKEIRLPEATFENVISGGTTESLLLMHCDKLETLYIPKVTFEKYVGQMTIFNKFESPNLTRIYCTKELYNKLDDNDYSDFPNKQTWTYNDKLQCAIKNS